MNEEHRIFDQIEKYHQGLLSEEEMLLVEKRMKTDASFAEYVTINGLVNTLVYSSGIDMLREKMTNDLVLIDQRRTRTKWKIGAGILAALLALTALVYYGNYSANKKSTLPDSPKKQSDPVGTKANSMQVPISLDKNELISPTEITQKTIGQGSDTLNTQHTNSSLSSSIEQKDTSNYLKELNTEKYTKIDEDKIKNPLPKECHLSFDAIVQASCKGEINGAIIIDQPNISGGTMPYRFKISDSNEETSSGIFTDLGKGNYRITVYDSKTCSATKEIFVSEKNCVLKKSYSFNPDYGESWKVPSENGESGSFTIYNRAGISIFKGNFTGYNTTEWNGTNIQGIPIDVGLYVSVIEYSGGKTDIIEITIVR